MTKKVLPILYSLPQLEKLNLPARAETLAAIESGFIEGRIRESAYQSQLRVESGEQVVVGVNAFQVEEKMDLERLKVDPAIEANQRKQLAELRSKRDPVKTAELMTALEKASKHPLYDQ